MLGFRYSIHTDSFSADDAAIEQNSGQEKTPVFRQAAFEGSSDIELLGGEQFDGTKRSNGGATINMMRAKIIAGHFLRIAILAMLSLEQAIAAGQSEADLQLQQAQDLYDHGKTKESEGAAQKALTAFKEENNVKRIGDATCLLGRVRRKLGNFSESKQLLQEALKLHESINNEEAAGLDLIELANTFYREGSYAEAMTAAEKGLSLEEKAGNKVGIAKALNIIGATYHRKAEYDKSLDYLNRALSLAKEAGDKIVIGAALANLGSVYWLLGDFDRALDYSAQHQKIIEEIGDSAGLSVVVGNRGLIHWNQGDLNLALEEFNQATTLFQQVGDQQGVAVNYFNIGLLQKNLGNYTEAQETLQKSLTMAKEIGDKGLAAVCYEGLGTMYQDLGNMDTALDYLQRSLKMSQEIGEQRAVAYALIGIGSIYETRGNYSAALQQYRKGFRLFEKENEKKAIALSLQNLGRIYFTSGDKKRALANYQAALAIQESIGNKPGMARSETMIAEVYSGQGRLDDADAAVTKALDVLQKERQADLLWPALYRKALVCRDAGKTAESVRWMKEAVEVIEKVREDVQLTEQKSGFLEDKLDVYDDLIELLTKTGEVGEAFAYLERSKARAFLDMLAEARIDPQSSISPELFRKKKITLSELMNTNKKINEEYEKQNADTAVIQKLEKERSRADEEYLNLLLEIRKENPNYADLQYPQPLNLPEAQQMIDNDAVLIDYHLGKHDSLLFVITRSDAEVFHLPGSQKLSSQVQQLLLTIQKPEPAWEASNGSYTKFVNVAELLYAELLKPAERWLNDKRRLIIVPDGALNYLPFESLVARKSAGPINFAKLSYLTLDHEIQYVPSVSVLAAVQKNAADDSGEQRKELVAFADPVTGSKTATPRAGTIGAAVRSWSTSLPNLPFARTEVEAISKLYSKEDVRVLIGKEASEENVKNMNILDYRIIHIASHGLIDEERPQLSALVLTPGSKGQEDGFLTMREVFDLKLKADLVVLSACKTGLGRQIRGEGMDGLSRAFFFAGASRVLVSLWNVYDPSTADFMTTFYRNLKDNGMHETEALQQARLEMIHSKKYSHPYYWAPFILIGRN